MIKFVGFEWHKGVLYARFRLSCSYDLDEWDSTDCGDYSIWANKT